MKKSIITTILTLFAISALIVAPASASDEKSYTKKSTTEMTGTSGMDHHQRLQSSIRASELIGKEVVNRNQEELGEVEDIVIGRDGSVNYVVVSHGGVLGIGDNLIPVPFSAVEHRAESEDKLTVNMSKSEMEKAPNFANTEWPDFSDPNYDKDVYGYYGTTPRSESEEMKTDYQKDKTKKYKE